MKSLVQLSNFVTLCQRFLWMGLRTSVLSASVAGGLMWIKQKGRKPCSKELLSVQSCLPLQVPVGSVHCLYLPRLLVGPGAITPSWLSAWSDRSLGVTHGGVGKMPFFLYFAKVLVSHGSLGLNTWCWKLWGNLSPIQTVSFTVFALNVLIKSSVKSSSLR